MTLRSLALRAFLGAYLLLLLWHVAGEFQESSIASLFALTLGLAVAIYAHSRSGLLLYALLCLHMAIEWAGYGVSGWAFSWPDSGFDMVHLAFDVAFLTMLARTAWDTRWLVPLVSTLAGLASLSGIAWLAAGGNGIPEGPSLQFAEFLILGGIFGCTGYHLFRPFRGAHGHARMRA